MKKALALVLSIIIIMTASLQVFALKSVPVKSIKLNSTAVTIKVGETFVIKTTFTPANTSQTLLSYSTGNKNIAKVQTDGRVTGVAVGTTAITVLTPNKSVKATLKITVAAAKKPAAPVAPEKLKILTYGQVDFEYSEKLPVLAELEKRTNVDIQWQNLPVGQEATKLDLIFASGLLPDILLFPDRAKTDKLGVNGALIPLENLVTKNAPNIAKTFSKMKSEIQFFKERVYSADGHIYNIPTFTPAGANAGMTWAIREDWCKNVGLSIPTTTDELYTVLKAFKEKDPNKNGKADELPLVSRNDNYYLQFLVNSFGVQSGLFWDPKASSIKYGPLDSRYKEAIAFISKLYAEGLIDPEYLSNTNDQLIAKVSSDRAGMFLGGADSFIGASHDALKKLNKNFNLVSMLPVAGPYGDRFKQTAGSRIQFRGSITSACKKPDVAMKFLDYAFSDKGHELLTWGIEGQTYTKVGNRYQILDFVTRNSDGLSPQSVIDSFGINPSLPHVYDAVANKTLSTPFVATIYDKYASVPGILREDPQFVLTTEESDQGKKYIDMLKYVSPSIAKFIAGKTPMSEWDSFVEQVKKLGGDDYVKLYDSAYKRQYKIK